MEQKVIYPELSYQIIGSAFRVFNANGFGMSEKFYQNALAEEFRTEKLDFEKEVMIVKELGGKSIVRWFLDFVVGNRIVVELKVRPRFGYVHVKQTMEYLKIGRYKLAILIYFTKDGVKFRRILNGS